MAHPLSQSFAVLAAILLSYECGTSAGAVAEDGRLEDGREVVLASGQDSGQPKQPQCFVSTDGIIDIVWAVGEEIRLSTSKDNGTSFQPASGRIACPNLSAGMRRGPRVVRVGSSVVVTAIGGRLGKGKDGDLMAWSSDDDGATWSEPIVVNSVADAAREGLHAMAASDDGQIWCTWLDLRASKTQIYAASSDDQGRTWSDNQLVYQSPTGSVCECCHPSILCSRDGAVQVMFRNSLAGDRDMFLVSRQTDGTWSAGAQLGTGHWKLDACPMDGGMLATDSRGQLMTVWRREGRIYAAMPDGKPETQLGNGQQPWVAWSAAGPIFTWTRGRDGILVLQAGLSGRPRELDAAARDAVVTSTRDGKAVILCWEAKRGSMTRLIARSISTESSSLDKPKSSPR